MPVPVHGVSGLDFQDGLIYLRRRHFSRQIVSSRHHQVYHEPGVPIARPDAANALLLSWA
jgi:hypothetical protein